MGKRIRMPRTTSGQNQPGVNRSPRMQRPGFRQAVFTFTHFFQMLEEHEDPEILKLIQALERIKASDIEGRDEGKNYLSDRPVDPEVRNVIEIANRTLIFEGSPDNRAIDEMAKAGYSVGPGETDSHGWVSGIIYTCKGMIVFG